MVGKGLAILGMVGWAWARFGPARQGNVGPGAAWFGLVRRGRARCISKK